MDMVPHPHETTMPPHIKGIIDRYISDGVPVGSFLEAVICNDLKEAMGQADDQNIVCLFAIVKYFYNDVPTNLWRSREAYIAHLEAKSKEREAIEQGENDGS